MKIPIADLHCDLLTFLAGSPSRTAFDPGSRCSIPQMKEGNVLLQTMALYVEGTKNAHEEGKKQARLFAMLQKEKELSKIQMFAAMENASSILAEGEPITLLEERIEAFCKKLGQIFYISFTWNGENRFGGGAFTQEVGLKQDGKELLRLLDRKNIAVDLSHASDRLSFDLINRIDKEGLCIPIIASHSNCRAVHAQDRNLPDELIVEIIKRKGLIGLNFVRHFIDDESFTKIRSHAEHILNRGGEDVLSLGCDFFAAEDLPPERYRLHKDWFFEGFDNASTLQKALHIIEEATGKELIGKVACQNVLSYIARNFYGTQKVL